MKWENLGHGSYELRVSKYVRATVSAIIPGPNNYCGWINGSKYGKAKSPGILMLRITKELVKMFAGVEVGLKTLLEKQYRLVIKESEE